MRAACAASARILSNIQERCPLAALAGDKLFQVRVRTLSP
jgi:hypothetical protein